MLLIVGLFGFVTYRWTLRVASRTPRSASGRFAGLLVLKMLWRIGVLFIAFVAIAGASSVTGAGLNQTWLALAILSLPINVIVMVVTCLRAARQPQVSSTSTDARSLTANSQPSPPPVPAHFVDSSTRPQRTSRIWILAGFLTIASIAVALVLAAILMQLRNGATASRDIGTSTLIHGHDVDFTIRFPSNWTIKRNSNAYDVVASSRDLYFGVIADPADLGSCVVAKEITQKNLLKGASDARISESRPITLDGREWLGFVLNRTAKNDVPVAYQFYIYSGSEGTYQLVTWAAQRVFDRDASRVRSIIESFSFPANFPSAETAARLPAVSDWKRVVGGELACSIKIPPSWKKEPVAADYTILISRGAMRVGVIAQGDNQGSPEALAEIARKRAAELTAFEATEPTSVQIDGRRWLQFNVKCEIGKVPMTYQFFTYAGPEGSYQIVGWTIQNLFDRDSAEICEVMRTFEFPP